VNIQKLGNFYIKNIIDGFIRYKRFLLAGFLEPFSKTGS